MNKKLVAVAIAGLLTAPLAQAQTANVTLYGRLNMDAEWVSSSVLNTNANVTQPASCTVGPRAGSTSGCITTKPNQFRVSSNSSRFGIRGTESLGGGLNAVFQVENSLGPDNGSGQLAGRDSFLGFQGSWGLFRIGRFHAPYDNIHEIWGSNPTLLTSILATSAMWAQGFTGKATGGFDDRVCNSVRWDSPVMAGFQLQMQYGNGGAVGAEGTPKSNSGVYSAGVFYNNGPLVIGVAGQYNEQFRGASLNDFAVSVAGSYQFPGFKIGAVYERLEYDCWIQRSAGFPAQGTTNCLTSSAAGMSIGDLKRNFWGVGVTINIGAGQLYADYSRSEDGEGSAVSSQCRNGTVQCARIGGLAGGNSTGADQYEISYTYPLSKRTSVWAGYNRVANDSNASYNFGVNAYGNLIGAKPQGFAMGAWHNF